jgi:hypothetical protein
VLKVPFLGSIEGLNSRALVLEQICERDHPLAQLGPDVDRRKYGAIALGRDRPAATRAALCQVFMTPYFARPLDVDPGPDVRLRKAGLRGQETSFA